MNEKLCFVSPTIVNKETMNNKVEMISKERSYLCNRKWLITVLKWLGYFPIITNHGLTKFQMKLNSWPFILHILRALVFFFFYSSFLLQNISPNRWNIIPHDGQTSQAEGSKSNNSFIHLSYSFDFRSLVDFSHLILLISYVLILSVLCKPFARNLNMLCQSIQELDSEVLGNHDGTKRGFGKIYTSIVLELVCHLIYLILEIIIGILDPEWWKNTMTVRLYLIMIAIIHIWISIIQILFEVFVTESGLAIEKRLRRLTDISPNIETQNLALSSLVKIMETFQATFGGIMALHLSFYTIDILTALFTCIILVSRGNYLILISIFYMIGRVVRVYNIVSVCDDLSHEVLKYSDHLEEIGIDMPENSREVKVS